MKNYLLIINFFLFQIAFGDQYYQKHIQNFLENNFTYNHVGLVIESVADNKVLYQQNANKLFIPASSLKLFTLVSSLDALTPKFKFTTNIKWDPKTLKHNKLDGDIAILFTGDPSFTQQDLEKLIVAIKKVGINSITGNIIIDDTLFTDPHADGISFDDLIWGYAAPASAIIIAENKVPITINPINRLGQSVDFFINKKDKKLYPLSVNSKVIAVTQQQTEDDCSLQIKIDQENKSFISGCVQIHPTVQHLDLALNSPRKYLQDLLMIYLQKHNINLAGKIVFHKTPKEFLDLEVHYSLPLLELLKKMMKESHNLYADSIGKTIGAKLYGQGSFKTASKAITNILRKKFSINISTLNIVDASGLSNYNVVTPNHIARLLRATHNNKDLLEHVVKILPQPGMQGTLRNRLTSHDLKTKILAKTGTLRNSSSIAGYITTKLGKQLVFVFMVNNLIQSKYQIKQLEDELCELLINYGN